MFNLLPSLGSADKKVVNNYELLEVIAAVPNEFPHYYNLNGNGDSVGFAIDLFNAISSLAGIKVTYQNAGSWDNVHKALSNKTADLIPNLGISAKRQAQYDFTVPVETFPISIFVRDSSTNINSNIELTEHKVAVVDRNVAVTILQSRSDLTTIIYENPRDALFALLSSEVDAVVYPKPVFIKLARSIGVEDQIKVVGQTVLEVRRGIAIRKGNLKLLNRLNAAVQTFLASPEYQKLYVKWHGQTKPYWSAHRVAWVMGSLLIVLLIIAGVWRYIIIMVLNRDLNRSISRRKQAEISLRSSEARMKGLLNTLPDLVWLKDKDGVYLACNHKFEGFFGEKEVDIVGNTDYDFVSKELADFFRKNDFAAKESGQPRINEEQVTFSCDGHKEWLETIKAPMYELNGDFIGVLGVGRDITERKEAKDKILYQAHFDSLTDLPNRFLSLDRLNHLINDAKQNNQLIALLFIDFDDFKKVNDSLGHETGDKLLIAASKRLKGLIRDQDTLGRLGGDEFILLLGGMTDLDYARFIAENILNNFNTPFFIDERVLTLTLSVGISIFPDDGDTSSDLLRKADSAMYYSKSDGRNTYTFFTEQMNQDSMRRLQLEGALKRGEFSVFYQPKVDLVSNEIMGAEALLRWNNPSLGCVSPEEFIPLVEQMGIIIELGKFVFDEALAVTAKWQSEFNKKFVMAINVSPRQFRDNELVFFIETLLKKYHIPGKYLEVEITEGLLMGGDMHIDNTLFALSEQSIGLAMDDFGTGYSSLSYLRRYPFNVLKIDRSFVNDITLDAHDKELVNAIIAMAHGLKLTVIAEGIEIDEQLSLLKEMGCDIGQGSLFSKPVSEHDFIKLLKQSLKVE